MNLEQQKLPDHLQRFHFTVVGGFAHGWKIPKTNGLKSLFFVPDDGGSMKGYEHVSQIFHVHETDGYLVVFAPSNLPSDVIARFLKGEITESCMKSFSVRQGEFELSRNP